MTCWNERTTDQFLNEIYRGGGSWNESFWNVPEFDALLDAARAEMDFDKRNEYYQEAQTMLHMDGGTIQVWFVHRRFASRIYLKSACFSLIGTTSQNQQIVNDPAL